MITSSISSTLSTDVSKVKSSVSTRPRTEALTTDQSTQAFSTQGNIKTLSIKPATNPTSTNTSPTAYVEPTTGPENTNLNFAANDATVAEIEKEQFVNQVHTSIC